ncbi:hypothetical protein DMENIID0001_137900 [Sergentomyia squamirostris]
MAIEALLGWKPVTFAMMRASLKEALKPNNPIGHLSLLKRFNDTPIEVGLHDLMKKEPLLNNSFETRIRKAKGAFASLRNIWRATHLNLRTKLRIFNSNVKSVLLYGCETWASKENINRLQNILRSRWPQKISNKDLHAKCNLHPIENEIRYRKWGWIGHTLRKELEEICREALD